MRNAHGHRKEGAREKSHPQSDIAWQPAFGEIVMAFVAGVVVGLFGFLAGALVFWRIGKLALAEEIKRHRIAYDSLLKQKIAEVRSDPNCPPGTMLILSPGDWNVKVGS